MILFDFSRQEDVTLWHPINDVVMGGISESTLHLLESGGAVFTGNVSLEHSGGFASIRSISLRYDLKNFSGIELYVLGDGKHYKCNITTNSEIDGNVYQAKFGTVPSVWDVVRLPFTEFVPHFRGKVVERQAPLDLSKILNFGLLISDKQEGAFRLEIASMKTYSI